jgi:hypothetical protein
VIVENLNAVPHWERSRRQTEPEISDVERTPDSDESDAVSSDDGSNGQQHQAVTARRKNDAETPDHESESDSDFDTYDESGQKHVHQAVKPHISRKA